MGGPPSRLLQLGLFVASLAYMYTVYNRHRVKDSVSVEQAIVQAWQRVLQPPSIQFRKIVIGINCNVDVIVSGTALLRKLKMEPSGGESKENIDSLNDLESTFAHYFAKGAAVERYISNADVFGEALNVLENDLKHQTESFIGGNAALMAQKLASSYMRAKILLVGPIGPRLKALLHPNVITQNSTQISKDELHIIMEYKQGEVWGDTVAPSSTRFITSHDVFSGSSMAIDMFFNTIAVHRPDLVILSGVHLLEFQTAEMWQEKLRLLKRNLGQLNPNIPIHLELGSMSDKEYARNVLFRIIPNVDSLGLNEQELSFLSSAGGGPFAGAVAGAMHVHKAVEILHWLINEFGKEKGEEGKKAGYRLQRIHFHCLTYHIIVSKGSDWSNLAASLAGGVRIAGRQACGLTGDDEKEDDHWHVELRTSDSILLDKEQGRVYELNPHSPLASWMRGETLFIFTPALVCKHPIKTVGLGDAISSTGLSYSQFYRFDSNRKS